MANRMWKSVRILNIIIFLSKKVQAVMKWQEQTGIMKHSSGVKCLI